MFLPLSNLTDFQRLVLDPATAPAVLEAITPEAMAVGMGMATFTPARGLDDPAIEALADTFEANDGTAVVHDTIQYLVERSEHETEWLDALARSPVTDHARCGVSWTPSRPCASLSTCGSTTSPASRGTTSSGSSPAPTTTSNTISPRSSSP